MENFFSFVSTWNEIKIWIGSFSWALELSFFPSAVDRDSLKPCITLKIKILVVGFLKKKYKSHFVLFFNADAKIFLRKIKKTKILPTKSWKKPPSKVAQNSSNPLFFPYCPDCPNGPNRSTYSCSKMWSIDLLYIEVVEKWAFFTIGEKNFWNKILFLLYQTKIHSTDGHSFFFVTKPSIPNNYVIRFVVRLFGGRLEYKFKQESFDGENLYGTKIWLACLLLFQELKSPAENSICYMFNQIFFWPSQITLKAYLTILDHIF